MREQLTSLATLRSLDAAAIDDLRQLGVNNLGDLLAYGPFRHARYLRAAHDNLLRREEVIDYVDAAVRGRTVDEILDSPATALRNVGPQTATILQRLGVNTVAELASFRPVDEAETIIARVPSEDSDPFAPPCVLPTCKKFSRNLKSYTSFFKEKEIRSLSVLNPGSSNARL